MATATALLQLKFKEFTQEGRTYIRAYRKRWVRATPKEARAGKRGHFIQN